jgi:hypothetical protein
VNENSNDLPQVPPEEENETAVWGKAFEILNPLISSSQLAHFEQKWINSFLLTRKYGTENEYDD